MARRLGCVCYCAAIILIFALCLPLTDASSNTDVHTEYAVPLPSRLHDHIHQINVRSLEDDAQLLRVKREQLNQTSTVSGTPNNSSDVTSTNTSAVSTPVPQSTTVQNTTTSPTNRSTTPSPKLSTTTSPATTIKFATSTKPPTPQPQTTDKWASTTPSILMDNHNYYTSTIKPDSQADYFVELDQPSSQGTLNSGHRLAVTISLPFPFRFYGHNITNITVATGGFIYMSPFLHQWLTATQYIAPLMANFDTSSSEDSNIFYKQIGNEFIIEWHNVLLKDQADKGSFVFQSKLKSDGTITFIYKTLPIPLQNISTDNHPVKVGLSDAFYNDTFLPEYGIKRRTIIEYHRVAFAKEQIEEGTVIILQPLPTCNIITNCGACADAEHVGVKFVCKWCDKVSRCSDGLDWYRQNWEQQGCKAEGTSDGNCKSSQKIASSSVAAIVAVVLVLALLLGGIGFWLLYAYTHPTSPSGIWLMEHRPSQMKAKLANMKFWKKNTAAGTKYAVESEA